ncbi:MAG TPA: hypothetical protein VEI02_15315 [Planctomycetota bacterium]|nr:hypothetical protein [Planctomycetota bacterium]
MEEAMNAEPSAREGFERGEWIAGWFDGLREALQAEAGAASTTGAAADAAAVEGSAAAPGAAGLRAGDATPAYGGAAAVAPGREETSAEPARETPAGASAASAAYLSGRRRGRDDARAARSEGFAACEPAGAYGAERGFDRRRRAFRVAAAIAATVLVAVAWRFAPWSVGADGRGVAAHAAGRDAAFADAPPEERERLRALDAVYDGLRATGGVATVKVALREQLRHPDRAAQLRVAEWVRRRGWDEGVDVLIGAVADARCLVRKEAIAILVERRAEVLPRLKAALEAARAAGVESDPDVGFDLSELMRRLGA